MPMTSFRLILSCLLFVGGMSIAHSQRVPCVNGFAGDYPCDGYDLVAHLGISGLGGNNEANDIWGWTDPSTSKEYALVGLSNGTAFVDLCDPQSPELVGFLPTHSNSSIWRDIKVHANHAFIVSEASGHGMQVFDLTQLETTTNRPANFTETAHNDSFGNAHNIAINEESGYAYVIGANPFSGGPIFINIQDPSTPIVEGGFSDDGYTHDAQIVIYNGPDADYAGQELFFGCNANSLTIVDVTDKSDPQQISRNLYPQTGYSHQGWLTEDQRYFLLNDELDEQQTNQPTRTLMFDCLDLDNPVYMGAFSGATAAIDHNMYVKGDLLYQSNYTAGLRVIDISNIATATLEEVAYFDVHPSSNSNSFNGAWSIYPYFDSGLIVISSIEQGLFVVQASGEELLMSNCQPSAISELNLSSQLTLYPNPASDVVNVSMDNLAYGQVELLDAFGRSVMKKSLTSVGQFQLDLSGFAVGTYILNVRTDEGIATKRLHID